MTTKRLLSTLLLCVITTYSYCANSGDREMNKFIDNLMKKMTIDEKIGQLNLSWGGVPGVIGSAQGREGAIREGLIGATGGSDYNSIVVAQKIASTESRLKIPVLIGYDVIHGFRTVFPIPLASSCSWNLDLIERSARVAAVEASAFGINWTYSPMVDISRDARWGRIAEGSGEDPYLGSCIAQAMVRGYQGDDLAAENTILACVKHFALYGAVEAGRDYNTVEVSRPSMYNYYFPPYKAAIEAGVATAMSSFNVVDGVPAAGNKWLLTDVLRKQWGFDGFVVSDASAVGEMSAHGMGNDDDVTALALNAGNDMDMSTTLYVRNVKRLIAEKRIDVKQVELSCRRILEAKYKLGLFDNPFKYTSNENRENEVLTPEHRQIARELAAESIVLLKNSEKLLPIKGQKHIAVVGPLGDDVHQLIGTWASGGFTQYSKSVYGALKETELAGSGCVVTYNKGANFTEDYCIYDGGFKTPTDSLMAEAQDNVKNADIIIAAVGEPSSWSGEARSRVDIQLPQCQKKMLKMLKASGKPVVVLVMSGRPLALTEEDAEFSTIIEAWHGGTMAGYAIADVLTGKVNPSGKITATFPRSVGQEPIYYNHLNTGRPAGDFWATSKYIDGSFKPLYPFGYGLSYTAYKYGVPTVSKSSLKGDSDVLKVSVDVSNVGEFAGKEIVQLYVNDCAASISRPVKELKSFQKVQLNAGESKIVTFDVDVSMLKFYDSDLKYDWESGDFDIMVGPDSDNLQTVKVNWSK